MGNTAQFNVFYLLQADFYPDVCKQALNSVFTQKYLSQCSTVADLYLCFLQRAETRITCICLHNVYQRTFQRTRPASPWLDCAGRIVSIFCGKSGEFSCIAYHSKKKTGKDRLICCCWSLSVESRGKKACSERCPFCEKYPSPSLTITSCFVPIITTISSFPPTPNFGRCRDLTSWQPRSYGA